MGYFWCCVYLVVLRVFFSLLASNCYFVVGQLNFVTNYLTKNIINRLFFFIAFYKGTAMGTCSYKKKFTKLGVINDLTVTTPLFHHKFNTIYYYMRDDSSSNYIITYKQNMIFRFRFSYLCSHNFYSDSVNQACTMKLA